MTATIDTSTHGAATGFGNQKKVVRLSDGVLVAVFASTSANGELWYSNDNGATWTQYSGSDIAGFNNGSISAYVDSGGTERLVAVWKQSGTGGTRTDLNVYVNVGTFNAGKTSLTWSTAVDVTSSPASARNYPDVVAHAEGTGGAAHVVMSVTAADPFLYTTYEKVSVDSSGVPSVSVTNTVLGGNYTVNVDSWPSITVNPATKDLYAAWSAGSTGSGKGIRFKKATYSIGTWTWGTEREIDSARYLAGTPNWLRCLYDGTRIVIVGEVSDGANNDVIAHERDLGDTTTTPRELSGNVASASRLAYGSASYDLDGNLYVFGVNQDEADGSKDLVYRKWTRAGASLGSEVVLDSSVGDAYVSAKIGSSNSRIEVVYRDGTGSPYNVRFESIVLNQAPTAPTWVTSAGAKDVDASLNLVASFNDPDVGDTVSAYALKRDIGGTVRWWDGTDWDAASETWVSDTDLDVTLASGWGVDGDANHSYYFAAKDAAGLGSPGVYSTALVITPSAKVNPAITEPDDGDTYGTASINVTWTVAEQSAYRLRLLDEDDVELWSSGWVDDVAARVRTVPYTLANGSAYSVELATKNADGLASTADTNAFTVNYVEPATASIAFDTSDNLKIVVDITNPDPVGFEPTPVENRLWRRAVGDTSDGRRLTDAGGTPIVIAPNGSHDDVYVGSLQQFEYRVETIGDNGTAAFSEWDDGGPEDFLVTEEGDQLVTEDGDLLVA